MTPRLLIRMLRVFVAFSLAAVVGWFSPWITASLWRVFHPGGHVTYRGLNVQVPWPWVAETDLSPDEAFMTPQGLGLKKMPPTMSHRIPPQAVFVTVISPDPGVTPEEQTQRWLQLFRNSHPADEFLAAAPETTPAEASCLSAVAKDKPNNVVWTCISVKQGWVANFEGRKRDEPAFLEVVRGLKR